MVKKFRDAEDVLMEIEEEELSNKEKEYRKLMQQVPNFNHENFTCDKKVYENGSFIVLKVKSRNKVGYIACNTKKIFKDGGHTHLNSLRMAKTIIDNQNKKYLLIFVFDKTNDKLMDALMPIYLKHELMGKKVKNMTCCLSITDNVNVSKPILSRAGGERSIIKL